MRLIDEQYLLRPHYGIHRMWQGLIRDKGYKINLKRVRWLYRLMGLEAIGPKPKTSKPAPGHTVYTYLLKSLKIEHSDHVWATDITYVPMAHGFMYLIAIIDLKSRYVLNCSVSNTMDAKWCAEVFLEAVGMHGAPKIVNTDQGGASSPVSSSPKQSSTRLNKSSPWMARAEQFTTFSLNGYGEASSMSTFT